MSAFKTSRSTRKLSIIEEAKEKASHKEELELPRSRFKIINKEQESRTIAQQTQLFDRLIVSKQAGQSFQSLENIQKS